MKTAIPVLALLAAVALVPAPALALTAVPAGPALAGGPAGRTLSVWQGPTANLQAGQSHAAAFDLGLLVDPARERVRAATLTLAFIGADARNPTPLGVVVVPRMSDLLNLPTGFEDTFTRYADPLDSVDVVFGRRGGQGGSADDLAGSYGLTSAPTGATPVYGVRQVCSGLFIRTCHEQAVHVGDNYQYDRVDGYRGAFSFSSGLDATSLQALSATGQLRYAFTVQSGGVALESALLSLVTAPVPEPTSAWLALAGLALGLPWVARRRGRLLLR